MRDGSVSKPDAAECHGLLGWVVNCEEDIIRLSLALSFF